MKKMRRMAALLLSCVLVAACPGIGSRAEEDTRGDFVFGDYVGDVDPASGAYAWVGMRVGVMESLFKLDDGMNVQKNLVDDYSVSEDGLVWTLKLRDGVLFQSGNPMDAEAVKASLERTCSMAEPCRRGAGHCVHGSGRKCADDHNEETEPDSAELSL